jgi:type III secretion protein V
MAKLVNALNLLARQKDILLVVILVMILMMMFMPLPAALLDVLLTINISVSLMILLMTMQLHNPVQFSTFPALLLVTTLYRLGLSISTTRLILIEGDAGKIVETFGNVVAGGNLVVGLVIFLIITIAQFLVITKGADRVAEVGARFTLDGMPGKQMSVDADVRAGSLDHFGAKQARQLLEREAKLFGAMDGAMKFVKGDAIASLVITAVNLIGGVAIGMAQWGLPFGEALQLFSILTIGDGLVGQIPALMISVAAGTMVTRVTNPKGIDLGSEIAEQVTANHRTLTIAGVVIAGFGFIPGFPTLIFLVIGLGTSGGIYLYQRKMRKAESEINQTWTSMLIKQDAMIQEIGDRTGELPTITLYLPRSVLETDPIEFLAELEASRQNIETTFGVPMGIWKFQIFGDSDTKYRLDFQDETLSEGEVRPDCVFVRGNMAFLSALDIPCVQHFGSRDGVLVSTEYTERLQAEDIKYWTQVAMIIMEAKFRIATNLDLFIGLQSTSRILSGLERSNSELVSDLKDTLAIQQISATLKLLVQERIPIMSKVKVFEAMLQWAPKRPDPLHILQHVRIAIGDFITKRFSADGFLPAIIVAPSLESIIREGFRQAADESYLVVDSKTSQIIIEQITAMGTDSFKRGSDPVIVTQQDIRRAFHNLLYEHGIYIPVLSYQEITPTTVVYPVDFITPERRPSAAA